MTSPATVAAMYAALKLASCWCTEPVWYLPKAAPIKCSRCKAIELFEMEINLREAHAALDREAQLQVITVDVREIRNVTLQMAVEQIP